MRGLFLLFLVAVLAGSEAFGFEVHPSVVEQFLAAGGNAKAIDHLKCFLQQYERTRFAVKDAPTLGERCNQIEGGAAAVSVGNLNKAVIVDFTKPSSERRFYVLDLSLQSASLVKSYYVSHGRFGDTDWENTEPGPASNTVRDARLFSNRPGSNASSTGFYITGYQYQGSYTGPAGDKYSMIVHGIEKDTNDNACERTVVVHGNGGIRESGPSAGVHKMSSGCFMLDYDRVNQAVAELRGTGGPFHEDEPRTGGTVLFAFGPRESQMPADYYCSEESRSAFRIE